MGAYNRLSFVLHVESQHRHDNAPGVALLVYTRSHLPFKIIWAP